MAAAPHLQYSPSLATLKYTTADATQASAANTAPPPPLTCEIPRVTGKKKGRYMATTCCSGVLSWVKTAGWLKAYSACRRAMLECAAMAR